METRTVETLSNAVQWSLIVLGFAGTLVEIYSDEFKKGEPRHNILHGAKIFCGIAIGILGIVGLRCSAFLDRVTATQMDSMAAQLSKHRDDLDVSRNQLSNIRERIKASEIRRIANIRPDGMEVVYTAGARFGAGAVSELPSKIMNSLTQALGLMGTQPNHASQIFSSITAQLPEWPYAYFYLGVLNKDPGALRTCAKLCKRIIDANIVEPEPILFQAMAHNYLKEFQEARRALAKLEPLETKLERVPLIRWPKTSPEDIIKRFERIGVAIKANSE